VSWKKAHLPDFLLDVVAPGFFVYPFWAYYYPFWAYSSVNHWVQTTICPAAGSLLARQLKTISQRAYEQNAPGISVAIPRDAAAASPL
jgi:hypothetical protein